jgi:hypothetical protein
LFEENGENCEKQTRAIILIDKMFSGHRDGEKRVSTTNINRRVVVIEHVRI